MSQFPGPDGPIQDQPTGYQGPPPAYQAPPPAYQAPPGANAAMAAQVPSMGTRLVARLIDWLILTIPLLLLRLAFLPAPWDSRHAVSAADAAAALFFNGLSFVLVVGYEVGLIGLRGATIGKQVMKIKVVLADTGRLPGFGPAVLRWLIPFVGSFACLVGACLVYISPFFDSSGRRQGWHDKVAHTQVVSAG